MNRWLFLAGMALLLCPRFLFAQPAPRVAVPSALASEPDAAARFVLSSLGETTGELRLVAVRRSPAGSHVRYQPLVGGVPLYGAFHQVHLDPRGQPVLVQHAAASPLSDARSLPPPTVSEAQAREVAASLLGEIRTNTPELVAYPEPSLRPAWRLIAWPRTGGEIELLLDARTGALIQQRNQALEKIQNPTRGRSPTDASKSKIQNLTTGSGYVFDPDPLSTAGMAYAPPYVDNGDADVPELNAERVLVDLPGLTRGTDRRYRLIGPHVAVTGMDAFGEEVYTPPAERNPHAFRYTRSDERFEAVNVYYHIDTAQRYIQSLGFEDLLNEPLPVNPHAYRLDNAQYLPTKKMLLFGDGGVDDAEDASVIWHEYAHALLDHAAPGLFATDEGNTLHEGFADYWAASHLRHLYEAGRLNTDWRRLFAWDGNTTGFIGRIVAGNGLYPDDFAFEPDDPYTDGLQWASTLMQIWDELGGETTDRLVLQSLYYLPVPVTFADAAEALLEADTALYDGEHTGLLVRLLGRRGFMNPIDYGPTLSYRPTPATEQLGGTTPVHVMTMAATSVDLIYQIGSTTQILPMIPATLPGFRGDLPLPDAPGVIRFAFIARDHAGRTTRLPELPEQWFEMPVGPDTEPPVLRHTPPPSLGPAGWPFVVEAEVIDPYGVDSVWVDYQVNGMTGSFGLVGSYSGTFSRRFPDLPVQPGDPLTYTISARDRSAAGNRTDRSYSLLISDSPLIHHFDFETDVAPVQASSPLWQRGRPGYGMHTAYRGESAWATVLDGPYTIRDQVATLDLALFDLDRLPAAYLVFWHWYDTGHGGEARPGKHDALLYDGGNVQLSTDGGQTWQVATPLGGYSGTILQGFGNNPLGGQPAFGGYSFTWQRAVLPLPTVPDVRVRFAFGTNADNNEPARYFAGWMIDEVSVVTEVPADAQAPEVLTPPPPVREQSAARFAAPPALSVRADDDTGITRAVVHFEAALPGGTLRDSTLLEQDAADLTHFRGLLPIPSQYIFPGLDLRYTLALTDAAGNRTRYPASGEPLRMRFFEMQHRDLLDRALLTGNWQLDRNGWHLTTASETSGLVFERVDVPQNATDARFVLRHYYAFSGNTGRVELSTDGGYRWQLIAPESGYPAPDGFAGTPPHALTSSFDLSTHSGQQVWLRVVVTPGTASWQVEQATLLFRTTDADFETLRTFALYPVFPNPARDAVNYSFTIAMENTLRLVLYDATGRRVREIMTERREPGTYTERLDLTGLAAGTYFLRLTTGMQQATQPIIVVR